MALDKFRASPLPNPPGDYDPQYVRQLIRVLENYFSQLDSNTPNHAQQYTADRFVGGSFSGTTIAATDVSTTTLEAAVATIGYERANGVWTDALISYGHRNGRQVSDDLTANNIYGGTFYGDGEHIAVPYNQFESNQNQTASAIDQAYALTLNVNDFPGGITVASNSRITVSHAGIYQFEYSIQFTSNSTGTETIDIWLRKNGTDIAASNSQFSLPARKSAGVPSALIAVTPFMVNLAANDYIEIMWHVSATSVSVAALSAVSYSAGVTPTIPATPSAFVTVQFISAQYPVPTYVAPLPVFGFGQIGTISVVTP